MWITHLPCPGFSGDRCLWREAVLAVLSHTWSQGTQAGLGTEVLLTLELVQTLSNIYCPLPYLTERETEAQVIEN